MNRRIQKHWMRDGFGSLLETLEGKRLKDHDESSKLKHRVSS